MIFIFWLSFSVAYPPPSTAYPAATREGPYVIPPPMGYPMKDVQANSQMTTLLQGKLELGGMASGRDGKSSLSSFKNYKKTQKSEWIQFDSSESSSKVLKRIHLDYFEFECIFFKKRKDFSFCLLLFSFVYQRKRKIEY